MDGLRLEMELLAAEPTGMELVETVRNMKLEVDTLNPVGKTNF